MAGRGILKGFERSDLIFSLCGLNCGLCPMRVDGHCPGCGGGEGNQPCKIARCSLGNGNPEYCSLCQKFPCEKYGSIDEFDSFITHRNQKEDLKKRDEIGTEEYQREQEEKMEILEWLLQNYNDGRKKSFFCRAVNLLELQDLKMVKQQISQDEGMRRMPIKERAVCVKKLLEGRANEKKIVLGLRKKR